MRSTGLTLMLRSPQSIAHEHEGECGAAFEVHLFSLLCFRHGWELFWPCILFWVLLFLRGVVYMKRGAIRVDSSVLRLEHCYQVPIGVFLPGQLVSLACVGFNDALYKAMQIVHTLQVAARGGP